MSRHLSGIALRGAAAALIATFAVSAASAQDLEATKTEFMNSCAVCHGESGRGDGEFSRVLNVKPADLTKLAEKNNGEFPFLKVFQVIDGRAMVDGHGTRDMPIWGNRYQKDVGDTFGPYGGERAVRARVLELVYYVQSIQN